MPPHNAITSVGALANCPALVELDVGISFLPDYNLPDSESAAGTSLSGIVGALMVVVLAGGGAALFRFFRHSE